MLAPAGGVGAVRPPRQPVGSTSSDRLRTRTASTVAHVIPIGDDNTYRRRFPVVNYTLIVLNVAVFLVELGQPDPQATLLQRGAVPARITAGQGTGSPGGATLLPAARLHPPGAIALPY